MSGLSKPHPFDDNDIDDDDDGDDDDFDGGLGHDDHHLDDIKQVSGLGKSHPLETLLGFQVSATYSHSFLRFPEDDDDFGDVNDDDHIITIITNIINIIITIIIMRSIILPMFKLT